MPRPPRPSPAQAAVAAAGLLLAAAAALLVAGHGGHPDPLSGAQARHAAREHARGFTRTVTVPAPAPGVPVAATPRPRVLPPLLAAPAACKAHLDVVRDFMDAHPYGLQLDATAARQLSTILADLHATAACPPAVAAAFATQEVSPWLTWTAPQPSTPGSSR